MTAQQTGRRHKGPPLGGTNIQQHGPEFLCRSTGTRPNDRRRRTTRWLRKRGGRQRWRKTLLRKQCGCLQGILWGGPSPRDPLNLGCIPANKGTCTTPSQSPCRHDDVEQANKNGHRLGTFLHQGHNQGHCQPKLQSR